MAWASSRRRLGQAGREREFTRRFIAALAFLVALVSTGSAAAQLFLDFNPAEAREYQELLEDAAKARGMADFERAVQDLKKAEEIAPSVPAPPGLPLDWAVNFVQLQLAETYWNAGEYRDADGYVVKADRFGAVLQKRILPSRDAGSRLVGVFLNNLAALHSIRREFDAADQLYKRAIEYKKSSPAAVLSGLINLAIMQAKRGDTHLAEASATFERAEKLLKESKAEPMSVVQLEAAKTALLLRQGKFQDARSEIAKAEQVAKRMEPTLAPEDKDRLADLYLNNVALVHKSLGEYALAEAKYTEVIETRKRLFGVNHAEVGYAFLNLAVLREAAGDMEGALAARLEGDQRLDAMLDHAMGLPSDIARRRVADLLAGPTLGTLSMNVESARSSPKATAHAYETLMRRKGRALDAYRSFYHRLRADPEAASVASSYLTLLGELSAASQDASKSEKELAMLRKSVGDAEARLGRRLGEVPERSAELTLRRLQGAMPSGGLLLEYAKYVPLDARQLASRNAFAPAWALYVIPKSGPSRVIKLSATEGELSPLVERYLGQLRNPANEHRELARKLYDTLLSPVQKDIDAASRVFIVPDDELNGIPFAALVGPSGKYLCETKETGYLTSGRDLLREPEAVHASKAWIMGDPAFEGPLPGSKPAIVAAGIPDRVSRVPETRGEIDAVWAALRVRGDIVEPPIVGADATEGRLRTVKGPRILHIASHGFFAAPREPRSDEPRTAEVFLDRPDGADDLNPADDAMLHSGIALSGFNSRNDRAGGDGWLSAVDLAGLDLRGTSLVVLSACDTGLGIARPGDGIYGLRRAALLAGASSSIVSLWQVDSGATGDLMARFYRGLVTGLATVTGALRKAQLHFIKNHTPIDRSHPYYWAAFSAVGDYRPVRW